MSLIAPLPDAPDAELLAAVSKGDRSATYAEEALVRRYTPFVYSLARRCYRNGWERSDFVQEGMFGLVKAIREFSPDGSVPFQAYAAVCIRNELNSALRRALSARQRPLADYVSISAMSDILPDSDDVIDSVISAADKEARLAKLNGSLSSFEKKVLAAWLAGFEPEEISSALNKPRRSIENALTRIKAKAKATA